MMRPPDSQLLAAIIGSSEDGIVTKTLQGIVTSWNPGAEHIFGYRPDEAIGRHISLLFPPERLAEEEHFISEIGAGRRIDHFLTERVRKDGTRIAVSVSLSPLRDVTGAIVGVSKIVRDVTAQQRMAEILRRSEEEQRLLVSLNDATRGVRDPLEVMWRAVTHVGLHFGVARCGYMEPGHAQRSAIRHDYVRDVGSIAGGQGGDDLGPDVMAELGAGRPVVVGDVAVDPRTASIAGSRGWMHTRALLAAPLIVDGSLVAVLVLFDAEPRAWTDPDVRFLEQLAERTWFAVESARAAHVLREHRDAADAQAARLHLALHAARLGDWSWETERDAVILSDRAAEIFDLPAGTRVTWPTVLDLMHSDDRPRAQQAMEVCLTTGADYSVEFRLVNGARWRWVLASGRARYGDAGTLLGVFGVVQDVTVDRLLVHVDDTLRALSEPDAITHTAAGLLGAHLMVNRCAYATVEDDQDTFVVAGDYMAGTHSMAGRYRFGQFGAECLRQMRSGEPWVVDDSETDARLAAEDRSIYRETDMRAVVCVPIRKFGRFIAALAVHMNEPRHWETREIEIVQQVASRCWESIERARIERERTSLLEGAEAANRAKDEFLAMLGHELRNPLAPILTALQLMRLRADATTERERTIIERQVQHLTRLVDDLLDVERIARGKIELRPSVVELAEVVASAIEVAGPLIEQRSQTLDVRVPSSGLTVNADIVRLRQVISNLLTNAVKYTPAGGRITLTGARENGEVVLRVRDTGIGISPDVIGGVFDLFVQGRQTLDRAEGGLGLGLTIVRSLVERHGGSVSASSEGPGKGSEFVVRLPATPQDPLSPPGGPSRHPIAEVAAARPARILVVDDNEDSAELLAEAVKMMGHEAHVAHEGTAALAIAAETPLDAAFLDVGLPNMDGFELARRLRAIPALHGMYIVAVTGYGQESDRRRTALAGFDQHVVKPVDLETLEGMLGKVLAHMSRVAG